MSTKEGTPSPGTCKESVKIQCGSKEAELFFSKLKKQGKNITKCIKYGGKWVTPSEFETLAGSHARKWKQSIRCEGVQIGEWLATHSLDGGICSQASSQTLSTKEGLQVVDEAVERPGSANSQVPLTGTHSSIGDTGMLNTNAHTCSHVQSVDNASVSDLGMHNNSAFTCSHIFHCPLSDTQSAPSACTQHSPHSLREDQASICRHQLHAPFDVDQVLSSLEEKLSITIRAILSQAIESLKVHFEAKYQCLYKEIETLTNRVLQLEEVTPRDPTVSSNPPPLSPLQDSGEPISSSEIVSRTHSIQSQVNELSRTVTNQQHVIEMNERAKRERNILIVGLKENSESTEELVKTLLESQLGLCDVRFSNAKRLGRGSPSRPSPVLVSFESMVDKRKVMKAKRKLMGSDVYINNDLTKKQLQVERELKKQKQFLIKHHDYKEKRITIYKGKLWADRQLVTDSDLQKAGFSD